MAVQLSERHKLLIDPTDIYKLFEVYSHSSVTLGKDDRNGSRKFPFHESSGPLFAQHRLQREAKYELMIPQA